MPEFCISFARYPRCVKSVFSMEKLVPMGSKSDFCVLTFDVMMKKNDEFRSSQDGCMVG